MHFWILKVSNNRVRSQDGFVLAMVWVCVSCILSGHIPHHYWIYWDNILYSKC